MKINLIQPQISKLYVGNSIKFKCWSLRKYHVNNYPRWIFNNGPITGYANKIDWNTILITNIQLKHYGTYTCYGYYKTKYRREHTFIASATLKVTGKIFFWYIKTCVHI